MSHRTTDDDRERVRRGHSARIDSETADRVMSREFRTVAPRERETEAWDRHPIAEPAAVANLTRDLARVAVLPDALAVPCAEHDAEPGAYCYRGARGVCAARLDGRPRHA